MMFNTKMTCFINRKSHNLSTNRSFLTDLMLLYHWLLNHVIINIKKLKPLRPSSSGKGMGGFVGGSRFKLKKKKNEKRKWKILIYIIYQT